MNISNETAIVTGGASGFGLGIVEALVAAGANVAILDISKGALKKLEHFGEQVLLLPCDVSDPAQVENAVERTFSTFGTAKILVNNAGVMESCPLVNIMKRGEGRRHSIDLWKKVLDVNLNSAFYLTSAVADRLLAAREKGVIVNISSISARGNAGQSAYVASKAGLEAMSKVWAKELGPLGIRCGVVAPGFFDTSGGNDALEKNQIERWIEKTPIKRQGCISELVSSVLFIIENDFFNGETISVNGGLVV